MEQKRYDAFISYRHQPLDMAIAEQIQKLLEAYRPPRSLKNLKKDRIRRVFRDTTELPDSGDLGESLNQALASSDYLIVILSPELKQSKWCMQEIRTFKERHGNRCDHILPVLVRGKPEESIPDLLHTETRTVTDPDGVEREVEVEIEPLCCNVAADTLGQSKKKARTEFLRLAAPILGCGYDDLYRRNLRRARRRALAASLSAFTLISAVLAVVSVFAYKTYIADQNVRSNLVDVYIRNGANCIGLAEIRFWFAFACSFIIVIEDVIFSIERTVQKCSRSLVQHDTTLVYFVWRKFFWLTILVNRIKRFALQGKFLEFRLLETQDLSPCI
ncbi:MAG: toll/interleukin-1 receptor domain-containing protein [Clostridia bacterium]|nr:toll/interleukin-1 receptor domain-containing protein [Clostridia bacterium]